eukprot:1156440_1
MLPSALVLVFAICYYSNLSLIHAGTIAATNDSQYLNQTIQCADNEPCTVLCQTLDSCKYATILCPVSQPCDVKCNETRACDKTVIHAEHSTFFRLLDCTQGSWTCRGVTIYFPPNNQGVPIGRIIGGDFGLIGYGTPLEFHAQNGWKDVSVTTDPVFKFTEYHLGTMHCISKYNQSSSCDFAPDAWACANWNDTCNNPHRTDPPSTSPTLFPTLQPTHDPTLAPSLASHNPSKTPSKNPTKYPVFAPTLSPTHFPTWEPTNDPTPSPTRSPTNRPTMNPTIPTQNPTTPSNPLSFAPSYTPTQRTQTPTKNPTITPTRNPTIPPTISPTLEPTIAPTVSTMAPSRHPTVPTTLEPTVSPTKNPTLHPTNMPTMASEAPSHSPTLEPTNDPTVSPSNNPTISPTKHPSSITSEPTVPPSIQPTLQPSAQPTKQPSFTPSTAPTITDLSCNVNCRDEYHPMQIKVAFWFASHVTYYLNNIECFLYPIFVEWLAQYEFINSLEPCDLHIIFVDGGEEDATSCDHPPCIHSNQLLSAGINRRLLRQIDGNTTMTIITSNSDTTNVLERMSLDTAQQTFETHYLDRFAMTMAVDMDIEQQNHIKSLGDLNPLWYILIGLVVLLCCVVCIVTYQCIQTNKRKHTAARPQTEGAYSSENHPQLTVPNLKAGKMSASTDIDYGRDECYNLKDGDDDDAPRSGMKRKASEPSMELCSNPIHRSLQPKKNWTQSQSPDGGHIETGLYSQGPDPALNMIAGGGGNQMQTDGTYQSYDYNHPNVAMDTPASHSQFPELPASEMFGSFHPVQQPHARPINENIPWSAPGPQDNNAPYGHVPQDSWHPPSNPYPSNMNSGSGPYVHHAQNNSQFSQGNAYNNYNTSDQNYYNNHSRQGSGNMKQAYGAQQYQPTQPMQQGNMHNQQISMYNDEHARNMLLQYIQEDQKDDRNATNNPPQQEEELTTELTAITSGSSWRTTNVDKNRKNVDSSVGMPSMYRKPNTDTDDDVMDDSLRQMVLSATPQGATNVLVDPVEEVNILEDVATFLEFQNTPENEAQNVGKTATNPLYESNSTGTCLSPTTYETNVSQLYKSRTNAVESHEQYAD